MKMHTRAEHWISIGIITSICNISDEFLVSAADSMKDTDVQADRDLLEYLKGSLSLGSLKDIMSYHIHCMKGQPDNPEYGAEYCVGPIVNAKLDNDYDYNSAIAVAFHRLLVSALLSYVFRLRIVAKAVKAFPVAASGCPPRDEVMTAFIQLLFSAQLLFVVSHSRLFKKHLSLLSGLLSMPQEACIGMYTSNFDKFTKWHASYHNDKELIEHIRQGAAVQASATEASDTEASASEESDAGTTDEVLDSAPDADRDVWVVYRKWIMGLVDHFASIRVLERVSVKLPSEAKINFSILALNRPSLPSGSWNTMADEIQTLCKDSSLVSKASKTPLPPDLADKVIGILKTKIEKYKPSGSMAKTSARFEQKVYAFFSSLLAIGNGQPKSFTGCGHCEAILMAIIHCISKNKDDLDFSLKACSP
jgi:hypothetical protein